MDGRGRGRVGRWMEGEGVGWGREESGGRRRVGRGRLHGTGCSVDESADYSTTLFKILEQQSLIINSPQKSGTNYMRTYLAVVRPQIFLSEEIERKVTVKSSVHPEMLTKFLEFSSGSEH